MQSDWGVTLQWELFFIVTPASKSRARLTLQWRHNGRDSVSNHQPHDCLPNRLFRRRSKKTSKLLVTGLCAGNSPRTGEFPAHMASNAEYVSIWWRLHETPKFSRLLRLVYGIQYQVHWRRAPQMALSTPEIQVSAPNTYTCVMCN